MNQQASFSIDDLPGVAYPLLFGVLLVVAGLALDSVGFHVESGIVGALAVVVIGISLVIQLIFWVLGQLD